MSTDENPTTLVVDQSTIDAIASQVVANLNGKAKGQNLEIEEVKRQLKKTKNDKRVVLQSKGNQNQYQNQLEIEDRIDESLAHLKADRVEKAKESLQEGKTIIHRRKKLIRIADREDWATANEFRNDDLASDSGEDKRLRRAIKTARTDREKSYRKRAPYYSSRREPSNPNFPNIQHRNSGLSSSPPQRNNPQRRMSLDNVLCYHCQRLGHFANACPLRATHTFAPPHPLSTTIRKDTPQA